MKLQKPHFYAIFTLVIWSFAASISKRVFDNNPFISMNIVLFFSFMTLFIISLKVYGGISGLVIKIKSFKLTYFVFACFGHLIYRLLYINTYEAFGNVMSLSTILNYTWPLFTFIFIRIFINIEKFSKQTVIELVGLLVSFFGIVFLATEGKLSFDSALNGNGVLLGLGLGISYGIFSAFTYKMNPSDITAILLLSSGIGFVGFSIYNYNYQPFSLNDFSIESILWIALLGIIVDGLGYYYWGHAKSLANEMKVNIAPITAIVFYLPIFSLILLALLFKETVTQHLWFWVSFAFVFFGTFIVTKAPYAINYLKSLKIK